ncbi:hypothetical protein [Candidatus Ponderosibacter sp. Uisw_141_02]|uniref:hypothetical protein n=1 Tax=Candidatus Ponderosibacter sp. Uisw_141_02 TaxID=3231000 RepID=UPI003D542F14
MRKLLYILIIISSGFGILELLANLAIQSSFVNRAAYIPKGYLDFYQENYSTLHHLRDVNKATHIESKEEYIYTYLNESSDDRPVLVYLGDSWGEYYEWPNVKQSQKKFAEQRNITSIGAGISSYAPSTITSQVNLLREKFKISFSHAIVFIDQTDFGDELCRYKNLREVVNGKVAVRPEPHESNEVYSLSYFFQKQNTLRDDGLALLNILEATFHKFRYEMLKSKQRRCTWDEISKYLKYGATDEEKQYFLSTLHDLIKALTSDKNLKQVLLVTHPHYKHLDNSYSFYLGDLIANADFITQNPSVKLIDLRNQYNYKLRPEIYIEGDLASHVRPTIYEKELLPVLHQMLDF